MSRLTLLVVRLLGCAAFCGTFTGCLVVRHHTVVKRENEVRQDALFENDAARAAVEGAAGKLQASKTGKVGVFCVPFLCWISRDEVLSDNAIYNDQLQRCDTDRDGFITLAEAETNRSVVEQAVQTSELRKEVATKTSSDAVSLR